MPDPHSVENYSIGKGILHIGEWVGTTAPEWPGDYREMGNCPSIEVEPTLERLPHYTSRSGFRLKDKNPVIQTEYMVNFDCDEICSKNINVFLLGTLDGNTIHALQSADKEYALRFVSDNPIGPNETWDFWRATISPNGAMALIGEEWMVQSFAGEGLADVTGHATSPYFDVIMATTTTTTTTTTTSTTTTTTTTTTA